MQQKIRAELQQEIGSRCPLCDSTDAGVFEIHHIDENPAHHEKTNLILICPTCHSKIEKKTFTMEQVRTAKLIAANRGIRVEFVSAIIDEDKCCWVAEEERAFYKEQNGKPQIPIISFTLINHFPTTMVMHRIRLFVKPLLSGLSGIAQAAPLNSSVKYRLYVKKNTESIYALNSPLQIPAGLAAKFDTELYSKMVGDIEIAPIGRMVLFFTFDFNSDISLQVPPIFLNCRKENDPLRIWVNV